MISGKPPTILDGTPSDMVLEHDVPVEADQI